MALVSRAEARVRDRVRMLTGAEVLARQKEPSPSRALEQQTPTASWGGGNSPVRHEVVVTPADWGKLTMWDKEGFLATSAEPSDGQIYGRQNGMWVPVSGVGPGILNQWDQVGLSWDQAGVLWDQVRSLSAQIAALQVQLEALKRG